MKKAILLVLVGCGGCLGFLALLTVLGALTSQAHLTPPAPPPAVAAPTSATPVPSAQTASEPAPQRLVDLSLRLEKSGTYRAGTYRGIFQQWVGPTPEGDVLVIVGEAEDRDGVLMTLPERLFLTFNEQSLTPGTPVRVTVEGGHPTPLITMIVLE